MNANSGTYAFAPPLLRCTDAPFARSASALRRNVCGSFTQWHSPAAAAAQRTPRWAMQNDASDGSDATKGAHSGGTAEPAPAEATETTTMNSGSKGELLLDEDGQPLLHVVLVHPQIHWNTGNMGRTCLGLGARLHLVCPLGFSLDAKQIRRAGLDYWQHVDVQVHEDWPACIAELRRLHARPFYFTKFGRTCASDVQWGASGKLALVFGSEVNGFDGIRSWLDAADAHARAHDNDDEGDVELNLVAFPMVDDRFRSFNLSTTASMVRHTPTPCTYPPHPLLSQTATNLMFCCFCMRTTLSRHTGIVGRVQNSETQTRIR